MLLCVFNPTTTLIDVIDSSSVLSSVVSISAIAGNNITAGGLVHIQQTGGVTTAVSADATLNLAAVGFSTAAAAAGSTVSVSISGVVTIPTGSLVQANVGSPLYLSSGGSVSLTVGALPQIVGTLVSIGPSGFSTFVYNGSLAIPVTTPVTSLVVVPFSATPNFNFAGGASSQTITLTGNITPTFANAIAGQAIRILFVQDNTGNRSVTFPSNVSAYFPVTSPGGTKTIFEFLFDGTRYTQIGTPTIGGN